MPVLLKDVAGLVPGAWEGKGRGNRYTINVIDIYPLATLLETTKPNQAYFC